MPDDFVIARNPEDDTSLPYLLRIPYGPDGVIVKARETWPRTAKVYCHRVEEWPEDAEVVERVAVRSCTRRGSAIDLVLDRGRESRSQFVMSFARGGRQAIFWQTQRTAKQARPRVRLPKARAAGLDEPLAVVVDSHERYAWKFAGQSVTTRVARLVAGDYGVFVDDALVAAVERKSIGDLVSSLTTGKLRYQLADLAALGRAAVVVEDRYSRVFDHQAVSGAVIADGLAECQVGFPSVPIVFCDNRKLAQEWAYRFLAAAQQAAVDDPDGHAFFANLAGAPLPPRVPNLADIRTWAREHGHVVSATGRIPRAVRQAYDEAHAT